MKNNPFNKVYNRGKKGRYSNTRGIKDRKNKYKVISWNPIILSRKISLTFNFDTSKIIKYE